MLGKNGKGKKEARKTQKEISDNQIEIERRMLWERVWEVREKVSIRS